MKILVICLFLLFISGCSDISNVEKGLNYLNKNYDDGEYNDDYLKYVYPGEELEFDMTYRKLDAYFNVIMIKNIYGDKYLNNQIKDADEIFNKLIPIWEEGEIYNTINHKDQGYALDTYCIVGFLYDDKVMADNVETYLINNNWMDDNYYTEDLWRNIADESWCVRLLIKENKEVDELVNKLVDQTYDFIEENNDIDNVAVVVHTLYVINDYGGYEEDKLFFQEYLVEKFDEVKDNMLIAANILEALAETNYERDLTYIVDYIKSKQESDGSWSYTKGESYLRIFTTFRAVIALGKYEN